MNVSVQFAPVTLVATARRRLKARWWLVSSALAMITLLLMAVALTVGDYPLPVSDVVRSLLSPFTGQVD